MELLSIRTMRVFGDGCVMIVLQIKKEEKLKKILQVTGKIFRGLDLHCIFARNE